MVDRCRHKGFTYVMVLIAVAITALMAAGAAQVWSTTHQHQQLQQLRWIGNQYRQAIGSYYESSPGTLKRYPMALSDLVLDLRCGLAVAAIETEDAPIVEPAGDAGDRQRHHDRGGD